MDQGIVARVEEWEGRPYSGGYDGLRDLADADFSGAVTAAGAWLFVLNGRIVGAFDGGLPAFEDADGTAYAAPDPSLPLLFAMQETGGETQGRYYTDDTPLSEVEETLSEGGFTGFVELSENVLSGDYYVVFYGGRSMSAAFVGGAGRLLTGEDAFDRANGEVGIYEVVSVDLEVQDVPGPDTVGGAAGAADPSDAPRSDEDAVDQPSSSGPDGVATADAAADDDGEPSTAASPPETEPTDRGRPPSAGPDDEVDGTEAPTEDDEVDGMDAPAEDDETDEAVAGAGTDGVTEDAGTAETDETGEADGENETDPPPPGAGELADDDHEPTSSAGEPVAGAVEEDPLDGEEAWRESRSVPAIDPDESEGVDGGTEGDEEADGDEGDRAPPASGESRPREPREPVEELEARIEELGDRLDEVAGERDRLEEERDRLRRRVEELEGRLEADAGSEPADATRTIDPVRALSSTDLFVRYESKGEATLEDAHGDGASRDDVNANLRIEQHTRFEADGVVVDGDAYAAFLESTLEYRFVEWLVEDLLYEIRDTGATKGLRDLYDALPAIDRIAFRDAVAARDEEGEEFERTFDVVCRDRMGQPLLVADLNDRRDPATGEMMADLVERSGDVAGSNESMSAAVLVTASFFEPDALETAADATGGGLLNRESRRSFVKLSRKRGYHLCLVEARRDAFHVAVPAI